MKSSKYSKLQAAFFVIICTLLCGNVTAQVATEYFMKSSIRRSNLNPALQPSQGYLVIPILPNFSAGVKTNTLNLDHLTSEVNGERVTFMHKDVSTDDFLKDMKNDNYLMGDITYQLFGMGFYKGSGFWSINLDIKSHVDANLPKSLFALAKTGFSQTEQTVYDLENINATGNAYLELGVGYSRPFLNNSLFLGVRAKALVGVADFDLDAKSLSIEAGAEQWRAKSQVVLNGSFPGITPKYDSEGKFDGFEDIESVTFGNLGKGLGVDLGVAYDLGKVVSVLNGLTLSAAFNDLGFISWNKKNSVILESPETEVVINPHDYTIYTDGSSSLNDVFEDVLDDLNEAVNLKESREDSRSVSLRSTLNLGAEYAFLNDKLSVGALYSNRFGKYFNSSEFTASVNCRPLSWLETTVSYSAMHSAFDTFGFALHLAPSKGLNLFFASDYFIPRVNSDFAPTTSKGLNFQFGISIPLGNKGLVL